MADNALGQRRIRRVALGLEPVFEEHYGPLWAELRKHTILERVETPEELVAAISGEEDNGAPLPWALLITDAALTEKHYSQLWKRVVEYIRDGGTAICMGVVQHLRETGRREAVQKAGLSWEMGWYHQATTEIDSSGIGAVVAATLPQSYNQKPMYLKEVLPGEA